MTLGIDGHDLEGRRTGVGRYLINILKAWEQQGVFGKNKIILFFKNEIPKDLPKGAQARLLPKLFGKPSNALFMHIFLPFYASKEKVDVLFCPGYVSPIFWKRPIVLTLHDIIYEARPELFNFKSRLDFFLLKFISKSSAKKARRVLVPSEFTLSEVIKFYKIPKEKIILTRLAVDPEIKKSALEQNFTTVAEKYGLNGRYFFFVGSIFTRRHVPEYLKAFEKIAAETPDLQFLIAGKNYTKPYINIEKLAENINVSLKRKAVILTPYIPTLDLAPLYKNAEAFVWLSDYEGFALPPLEALSLGTAVITSNSGSIPETVGKCALIVKNPGDIEEIANNMRQLVNNTSVKENFRECGKKQAEKFSWDNCAKLTFKATKDSAGQ